jgi:uncharacterized membrane protein YfcA
MDIFKPAIIFFVALLAGAFGSLIGGSSIVTIPTLIFLGLPPHVAIGTDRFGIIGVGVAGWFEFHRKRLINYRIGLVLAIPILFGTFFGSNLVLQISEDVLKTVIVITNIIIMGFILLSPEVGVKKRATEIKNKEYVVGIFLSFLVGVYGGFYGAISGTLAVYILVIWFQQTFIQSAATQKIGSLFMTVTASIVFTINDAVDFYLGTAMLIGCLVGSYLGAHYAERIGNKWIKRLFVFFMVFVIVKLIFT